MDSLGDSEDPDDAALRHVLLPTDQLAHQPLLEGRVDSVAGLHRHILHAVDLVGRRRRHDTGVGLEVPKLLAGLGIVGAELTVAGAAREEQAAAGGEYRAPHHRARIQAAPNPLAAVDVVRLELAVEARLRVDREAQIRDGNARPPLSVNAL